MLDRHLARLALAATALLVACASTDATVRQRSPDRVISRPDRILVYDVAATELDAADDPSIDGRFSAREEPLTEDQIKVGKKLGSEIAEKIVKELRDLGLPAERGTGSQVEPGLGDVLVRGEFVEIDEGSRAARVFIGFGLGANELKTRFFTYVVTPDGPEAVGQADIDAKGGKTPGMILSLGIGGLVQGAAVGGAMATGKEFGPESIRGAADRTANEFMELVKPAMVERGWITKEAAD